MAKWILINTIVLASSGASTKLLPGHPIDDTVNPTATVTAAGGELWPAADATVAAMALVVAANHVNKGMSEQDMESAMRASTETSLKTSANLLGQGLPIHLRNVGMDGAAATNPYVNATPQSITLPDGQKVAWLPAAAGQLSAWARAGTGTLGPLVAGVSQTPAAGNFGISPTGDLLFNAADAFTNVDVTYLPERQDIQAGNFVCVAGTGVVTLTGAAAVAGALISVLEAEVLVGGVTGKCIVTAAAATAPTTGLCRMALGKTGVFFCIADAATSVRLKLGVVPAANN